MKGDGDELDENETHGAAVDAAHVAVGLLLIVAGLAWPLLERMGLGHLPGDIRIERENFTIFIPLTSGLIVSALVSIALSVVLWALRR